MNPVAVPLSIHHIPFLMPVPRAAALAQFAARGNTAALAELRSVARRRDVTSRAVNKALRRLAHSYTLEAIQALKQPQARMDGTADDAADILRVLVPWGPAALHAAASILTASDNGDTRATKAIRNVQDAARNGDDVMADDAAERLALLKLVRKLQARGDL